MKLPFSLRNLSIRTKLAMAFSTAFVLLLGLLIAGVVELNVVNRATDEIQAKVLPKVETLNTIELAAASHRQLALGSILITDFRTLAEIDTEMARAEESLQQATAQFRGLIDPGEEVALVEQFRSEWRAYKRTFEFALQRIERGDLSGAQNQFDDEVLPAFERAQAVLERLAALTETQSAAARAEADSVYQRANVLVAVIAVMAVVAAYLILVWVSRNVTTPLLHISDAMERLTRGEDIDLLAAETTRGDEIGTLLSAANGYRKTLLRSRELAVEAQTERQRLLAAISDMPIGLCMFDYDNRLIVCNDKFIEIYALPEELTRPGSPYIDILHYRTQHSTDFGTDADEYVREQFATIDNGKPLAQTLELNDGRTINTLFQPMKNGWVATHEDVTERLAAEATIRHMALHDSLTDLPNRIAFTEALEFGLKRLRNKENLAVLCLDLDRFKAVNDTLGHNVGDKLLQQVALRLKDCMGTNDEVARLGGDEFAIMQTGERQPMSATVLAESILEALRKPFNIADQPIDIGVSIGVALGPSDGDSPAMLLKNADMALYKAKGDGRGKHRFFEPDMDARMQERRVLELDMRSALEADVFEPYYQPVIDLKTNCVGGFEALMRWPHPKRGMVPPNEFIPLAEEIGLIVSLGEQVMRRACADAAGWPSKAGVAVNLSPIQFTSPVLVEMVANALKESGLDAKRLEIEITEGVLLQDTEETLETLHKLRRLGTRIALDDFGTGYSSLSYLRKFPFDKIKIDASFIRNLSDDPGSLAIVRAVTGLGVNLGMRTTAEGVETEAQLDLVRREGCTEAQGYLFSPAVPNTEVPRLISKVDSQLSSAA